MRTRIRTIKPEAHTDEDLWDLEQETGLPLFRAFVGLWAVADREGRFEWRPRALKSHILPYWTGDFARVLDALSTRAGRSSRTRPIQKYVVDGVEYGWIRSFKRHQAINAKEEKSKLPPPPEPTEGPEPPSCDEPDDDASGTRDDATSTREVKARVEPNRTEPNRTEPRAGACAQDDDPEQDAGPSSTSSTVANLPMELARKLLLSGYQRRYEAATNGEPWMGASKAHTEIGTCAAWVAAKPDQVQQRVDALLDGAFSDPWMAGRDAHGRSRRWPWGAIARDPAKYAAVAVRQTETDDDERPRYQVPSENEKQNAQREYCRSVVRSEAQRLKRDLTADEETTIAKAAYERWYATERAVWLAEHRAAFERAHERVS